MEVVQKFYSNDVVSVESRATPGMPAEMKGIEAIKGKNKWFFDNNEIDGQEINGPFVGENQFAVEYKMDVTEKASGKKMRMEEMALYTVANGKIVREHFYYKTS